MIKSWGVGLCATDLNKVWSGTVLPGTVLGHELVGRVAEVGEGVTEFREGERVAAAHHVPCYSCHYCLRGSYSMCRTYKVSNFDPGGFAEFVRLSARHVRHTTFHLPDDLPFAEAVFIEPLACCLQGIRRAGVRQDDVVWIIGAGSIGLLLAEASLLAYAQVVVSDLIDERLALARELGAQVAANPQQKNLGELIRSISDGRGADVVIPTVLNTRVVQEAIASLRDGGTLLLFAGVPSTGDVPLDLYKLWRREVNIVSSYSPDPASLADAYGLIARHRLRVGPIISHQMPLGEINRAIEMVAKAEARKVIIRLAER
ncbi:MAG: alcohol dehydrogenase catalytic domain-containing protein [Anaerolineae bacterium]|nr:alcohol dehydrogenase catalytic domain-containing protein [Anaerolineae bacterium]